MVVDILVGQHRDIENLKLGASDMDNTDFTSSVFQTAKLQLGDTFTGKARGIGSVFILNHAVYGKLDTQTPQPYLGGTNGSAYESGAFQQV